MMGRLKSEQGQLFYQFNLEDAVPNDHVVRRIDAALDLTWLRGELASHYSSMGRPSIDPELMIRMLVVGYVFAIRSERLLCREVQVNLAYRWFCRLGIEDAIPDHSAFSRARNERFREGNVFRILRLIAKWLCFITKPSSLLQAAPSLRCASVLSPSRLEPLAACPFTPPTKSGRRDAAQVLTFRTTA